MMRSWPSLCGALALVILAGCASSHPRPASLDEATAIARSPSAQQAAELAPVTFAEAEKLRRDAEAAQAAGDTASAQILAEQAIATHARAAAQGRSVRASHDLDESRAPLDAATAELAALRQQQQQVAADVDTLETRIKVARESLPVTASGPADAARNAARREAAQALETEARLLCLSTRLLAPDTESLKAADERLTALGKALADPKTPAPIDDALAARAGCLGALTAARRQAAATPAGSGDALLAELSRQGSFAVRREDRGVVVTLRDVFAGEALASSATPTVETLARVAAAHPTLPVILVVHDAEAQRGSQRDAQRGAALKSAIGKQRTTGVEVMLAGTTRPLVDPKNTKDRARNERVEVIFVDAGG